MSAQPLSVVCERVRMQISLELDGELSMLEKRMLDAHLVRCEGCRAYADEVVCFTGELRSAPLEPFDGNVVVRRPSRVGSLRAQVALASAAAVAVAVVAALQLEPSTSARSSASTKLPSQFPTLMDGQRESEQVVADARAFKRHHGSVFAI
jgi:predicted anti-sigma-YlaC factor YlaD